MTVIHERRHPGGSLRWAGSFRRGGDTWLVSGAMVAGGAKAACGALGPYGKVRCTETFIRRTAGGRYGRRRKGGMMAEGGSG